MIKNHTVILPIGTYTYFAKELHEALGHESNNIVKEPITYDFPDGETYSALGFDPRGLNILIVGGTIDDAHTLSIYDIACAAAKYGAASITLIIPYFGYSTMERANPQKPWEVVKAKTRARLLSSIPLAYRGNTAMMIDLHADITHYFEGAIHPIHLYAKPIILKAIEEIGLSKTVLASPDAGRAKWVESLAGEIGLPAAIALKNRVSGSKTELKAISGDVCSKRVILFDDMIRTGGSLINAGKAYKEAGAKELHVIATHGVLPNGSIDRLKAANLFEQVIITNSHSRTQKLSELYGFLKVISAAPVFAEAVKSILKT